VRRPAVLSLGGSEGGLPSVGAGADEVWPSAISVTTLTDRLHRNGHDNVTALQYPRAGHAVAATVPNLRDATIVESPERDHLPRRLSRC
jgi:hypothetical protein